MHTWTCGYDAEGARGGRHHRNTTHGDAPNNGRDVPIGGLRSWNTVGNLGNTNGHHGDCVFVVLLVRRRGSVVVDGPNILGCDGKCLNHLLGTKDGAVVVLQGGKGTLLSSVVRSCTCALLLSSTSTNISYSKHMDTWIAASSIHLWPCLRSILWHKYTHTKHVTTVPMANASMSTDSTIHIPYAVAKPKRVERNRIMDCCLIIAECLCLNLEISSVQG
jgi:hypothetical protein